MIKLDTSIPEIVPDITDIKALQELLTALKLAIDELSRKGQSRQHENRTTLPVASDIEENEYVSSVVGGLNYVSTKINGVIKSWLVS